MVGEVYPLDHRGLIKISGADRYKFLQGLITQDIFKLTKGFDIIYSAMLSAQGKFQHDFFLFSHDDNIMIDCERDRADNLCQQLSKFKLKSQIEINYLPAWQVNVSLSDLNIPNSLGFLDPRIPELGYRIYSITPYDKPSDFTSYDKWRIINGVPDGSRDIPINSGIILECGFEELNAIDWQKGCYLGQELTSRCYYRGLIRKRLFPIKIEGSKSFDSNVITQNEKEVGELRTRVEEYAIAMVRLEALLDKNTPLFCGNSVLQVIHPKYRGEVI